jgi:hypothetical protein
MDRDIDERNRAALDRLRAAGGRLSDDELLRPIDPPWTGAALFAHMAFWDRFVHVRWLHAIEAGDGAPSAIADSPLELVNQAALREWTVIPPRIAVEDCLTAAEAIDRFIMSLETDAITEAVRAGRERLVDRSLHRGDHLETIERAFPDR